MGIIGYGNIGRKVAKIAECFGMNVLVNTMHPEKYDNQLIDFVDKDELFAKSDIITLHCPLTEDTLKLLEKKTLIR